jgi:hypothetical protein
MWLLLGGPALLGLAAWTAFGSGRRARQATDGLYRRIEPLTNVRYDRLAKDPRFRLVQRLKRWLAAVTFAFLGAAMLYVWGAACSP